MMIAKLLNLLRRFPAIVAITPILALSLVPVTATAAQPPTVYGQQRISGTVQSFGGKYTMYVHERNGRLQDVSLHPGTIINPTGIQLEPGYPVTIFGTRNGDTFIANEIDTPFHIEPGYAYGYYPPPGYLVGAYPMPFWHPFFGFGWGGGWW
jgi:hypothetical protein